METTTVVSSSSPSEQDGDVPSSFYNGLDPSKVQSMLDACGVGNMGRIQELCREDALYARQQDYRTGKSPLMMAASAGYGPVCRWLLEEQGAPWNAVDRQGQCAGNYATNAQHWDVVNLLVDFATQAELILGAIQRNNRQNQQQQQQQQHATTTLDAPVQHQPSTKPDYLRQRLTYTKDALLDKDKDAVMMEWERPLMEAHAQILMESIPGQQQPRRVLNVGFGMGIIDTILQERYNPSLHVIVEAHPDVYQRMLDEGWNTKPNVRICFGTWQTVLPTLIRDEQLRVDAVFYDTYGEHFTDLEDFHRNIVVPILAKPHGIYSFFNGLAPDNLFFHGVACQCVKLQLSQLGLETEFLSCEINVNDKVWEGIRRKYWHGRETYYLPRVVWRDPATAVGVQIEPSPPRKTKETSTTSQATNDDEMDCSYDSKRQRT